MARLWDAVSLRPIGPPLPHPEPVYAVAIGPDGRTALTGGGDRSARVWDAVTGRLLGRPLEHSADVRALAISPDGRTALIAAYENQARFWDIAAGRAIGQALRHDGHVLTVAFSPDGKVALTGGDDDTARLWDVATQHPIGRPRTLRGSVRAVAFGPGGPIAATESMDHEVRFWDVATERPIGRAMKHPRDIKTLTIGPDGRALLTGSFDARARLWDVATGQTIGKPMEHGDHLAAVAFGPDGRTFFTSSFDSPAPRHWPAPPGLEADVSRLAAWVETITGLELDADGAVISLDSDAWLRRREMLDRLGGPPGAAPQRFDPILFGNRPTERADALMRRGRWSEARAEIDRAIQARPGSGAVREGLIRFDIARGDPEPAARILSEALAQRPDDLDLRSRLVRALLAGGDRAGYRRAVADLLGRHARTTDPDEASIVAWACAIGPDATADPAAPVQLAGLALDRAAAASRADALSTLGAVLYRAGRLDDAIRRLDEAIQSRGGVSVPQDWAFLAMAHFRSGHRDEARHWLDRLRDRPPVVDSADFWNELEIRLLRSEAEAVVLYDPVFPDDPFVR
jgi:tetratricopeptide (TPR) repeat protein